MKIVHLCLGGPLTDGWSYQENLLTKYQKKNGHDVTVIASEWMWDRQGKLARSGRSNYVNADGVRIIRLGLTCGKDVNAKFKKYDKVYQTLEECAPDILFIHGVSYRDVKTAAKYLKNHPHAAGYADNHGDLTNSGTNWLSRNILHRIVWRHYANTLVPYVRKFYGVLPVRVDFLVEMYKLPRERCELLVLGADDELVEAADRPEIKKSIRDRYGIGDGDFLVVTGGKIDAFKAQTLLLMRAVKETVRSDVKLIVFGSVAAGLEEAVRGLADGRKVQFIGWVEPEDSYRHFAAADLAVFPGRHSVFWEQAAAQGIPMLCRELPGTRHVDLGGNVRFLKRDSSDEIRSEIERLVNCPDEYRKMKAVAVEKGMKRFSYRDIARRAIEEQSEWTEGSPSQEPGMWA